MAPPRILSPTGSWDSPALAAPCPTFSWAGLPGAAGYELVVFRLGGASEGDAPNQEAGSPSPPLGDDSSADVALRKRLPAGATTWTPDLRSCLEAGHSYAWSLRVVGADSARDAGWAEPAWLEVSAEPSLEEVERALDVLRRYRSSAERAGTAGSSSFEAEPSERLERAGAPASERSPRASVPTSPPFEPLRQTTVGPRVASAASAPSLGPASLSLSQQLHLADTSAVFKGGELFLWEEVPVGRSGNTALGRGALQSNVSDGLSGTGNTAMGYRALTANTSGFQSTALGSLTLESNTSGARNVAVGYKALHSNTTGSSNVAIGLWALLNNSAGVYNTAIGSTALSVNTTGHSNTAIGRGALDNITTGNYNIGIGRNAGSSSIGSNNILLNASGAWESNVLRIGNNSGTGPRHLDRAFIHGIADRTVSSGGSVVFVDSNSQLGTKTCGTYVAASVCPLGSDANGPKCDAVPPGSFCESDGECGTNASLNNCGNAEWYFRND